VPRDNAFSQLIRGKVLELQLRDGATVETHGDILGVVSRQLGESLLGHAKSTVRRIRTPAARLDGSKKDQLSQCFQRKLSGDIALKTRFCQWNVSSRLLLVLSHQVQLQGPAKAKGL